MLRGRIEEIAGWALFNQEKTAEAIVRLRRAASVLPEGTPLWRTALWHLGAALETSGNGQEALASYIKSYNGGPPDPTRRTVIENLYRKVNGSLEGLDEKIGPLIQVSSSATESVPTPTATETQTPATEQTTQPTPAQTQTPAPEQPNQQPPAASPSPPATGSPRL
jgi:hypothetical protein